MKPGLALRMGRARRARELVMAAVLRAGEAMASELEAGQPPVAALEAATEEWPALAGVVRAQQHGLEVPDALRELAAQPGAEALVPMAAAWQVAQQQGAGLADALRETVAELRRDQATARLVAGELSSARTTAWLVALLPLGVGFVGQGMGADSFGFLLTEPLGWAAWVLGTGLIWAGLRWIEALTASVLASPHRDAWHHDTAMEEGILHRFRLLWCALGGLGIWLFLGSWPGLLAGVVVAAVLWRVVERIEPAGVRRRRERMVAELPYVVRLVSAGLRSGAALVGAVEACCAALPGPSAEVLQQATARIRWGADPAQVWAELGQQPALAPLGKALARSHRTGAAVAQVLMNLTTDLAEGSRSTQEQRARSVGVKAALPLGLCFMPAFIVLGIVPLVGSIVTHIGDTGMGL